jgi:hypothetical protein
LLFGDQVAERLTKFLKLRKSGAFALKAFCQYARVPINQSTNQPINQSTNQPINQSTNQPINQSTNQQVNQ